jgi:hypothetical protein
LVGAIHNFEGKLFKYQPMAENKKSFILYCDLINTINKLPDDKAGKLFKIILSYVNDENPTIDDILVDIAFEPIKLQLKRDLKKWDESLGKKSSAGVVSAFNKFKARVDDNIKKLDIKKEIAICNKRILDNGGADIYYEKCLEYLKSIEINPTGVDSVATLSTVTVTDTVNVTVNVTDNVINNINTENSIEFLHPQNLEDNNQSLEVKKENTVLPGGRQLHKLNDYIKQNYPTVFRLGQLTDEQCEFIIKTYPKDLIIDKLDAMENKKDLVKKYKSSFLTLKSWLKLGMENYKAKDQSRLSKNLSVLQSALQTLNEREQDGIQ